MGAFEVTFDEYFVPYYLTKFYIKLPLIVIS